MPGSTDSYSSSLADTDESTALGMILLLALTASVAGLGYKTYMAYFGEEGGGLNVNDNAGLSDNGQYAPGGGLNVDFNEISFVKGMLATVLMGMGGYFIYDLMYDPVGDVLPGYSYYSKTDNLDLHDMVSPAVASNLDGRQSELLEMSEINL